VPRGSSWDNCLSSVRSVSLVLRWIHVLAAITWIGGMLFLALVLVPITRRIEDRALRARLFHEVGLRFRTVGWIALAVLVATGLGNLWVYPSLLTVPRFQWKLGLVVLALVLSAVHDFVLGPRAGAPGASPSARARASWLARINVLVVLVVVLLGLSLLR
jgi:putative copper resistance protein D